MKQMQSTAKKTQGFGMIELIIAIAVVAIIAIFVLKVGKPTATNAKADSLVKVRDHYATCANNKLQTSSDTAAVSNSWFISRGCVSETSYNGTTIRNAAGGTTTFAPATVTATNDAFTLTDTGLSQGLCTSYANQSAVSVAKITVNSTSVKDVDGKVDESAVTAACKDDSQNKVIFTFFKA